MTERQACLQEISMLSRHIKCGLVFYKSSRQLDRRRHHVPPLIPFITVAATWLPLAEARRGVGLWFSVAYTIGQLQKLTLRNGTIIERRSMDEISFWPFCHNPPNLWVLHGLVWKTPILSLSKFRSAYCPILPNEVIYQQFIISI